MFGSCAKCRQSVWEVFELLDGGSEYSLVVFGLFEEVELFLFSDFEELYVGAVGVGLEVVDYLDPH